jgi:hypothetical protein
MLLMAVTDEAVRAAQEIERRSGFAVRACESIGATTHKASIISATRLKIAQRKPIRSASPRILHPLRAATMQESAPRVQLKMLTLAMQKTTSYEYSNSSRLQKKYVWNQETLKLKIQEHAE